MVDHSCKLLDPNHTSVGGSGGGGGGGGGTLNLSAGVNIIVRDRLHFKL